MWANPLHQWLFVAVAAPSPPESIQRTRLERQRRRVEQLVAAAGEAQAIEKKGLALEARQFETESAASERDDLMWQQEHEWLAQCTTLFKAEAAAVEEGDRLRVAKEAAVTASHALIGPLRPTPRPVTL